MLNDLAPDDRDIWSFSWMGNVTELPKYAEL